MNRTEAIDLAQRKANDWQVPYRVLLFVDRNKHVYKVEQSDSYDSPREWRVVEVCKPKEQRK